MSVLGGTIGIPGPLGGSSGCGAMCGGTYACSAAVATLGDERHVLCSAENNGFGVVNVAVSCWGIGACGDCTDPTEEQPQPGREFDLDLLDLDVYTPHPGDGLCLPITKALPDKVLPSVERGCLTLPSDSVNLFSLLDKRFLAIQCMKGICSKLNWVGG